MAPFLRTRSLRSKIFLRFTLLVGLALIASGAFSVLIARNVIHDQTVTQLLSLSNAHTRAIATTIDSRRTLVRFLGIDRQVMGFFESSVHSPAKKNELRSYLIQKTTVERSLQNVTLADFEGTVLVSLRDALEGTVIADSPDFQTGLQHTSVGTLGMASGQHHHTISTPVRSAAGKPLGVLIAEFSLHELYAALSESTSLGKTVEFLLIEPQSSGTACFSPRRQVFPVDSWHAPVSPLPESLAKRAGSFPLASRRILPPQDAAPLLCRLAASGIEDIISGELNGQPAIAAHRFLPGLGLGLIVKVDTREVFQPVNLLVVVLIGTTGILLLLVTFISIRLSHDVVDPILRLRNSLKNLNTGHWSHTRSVFTGNELEILDKEMKRLAGRLKEAYSSLEKRVEERTMELKQAHAKDTALLESIGEGVLAVDQNGRVITANRAAEHMLQWDRTQLHSSHFGSILPLFTKTGELVAPDAHPVAQSMEAMETVRSSIRDSLECTRKDGTRFPIAITATPYMINGEMRGVVVTFHDVTQERRMDRMKSEFVSLASHQLRTPLTAIGWYVELLDKELGELTDEQKSYVQQITESHQRMVDLVNALLNVSRIELGTLKIEPNTIDVALLARTMIRELQPQIQEKSLSIQTEFPESFTADIDPQLMQVVLENLLSNAIKYTPAGGEIFFIIHTNEDAMTFTIRDTGMGIPEKDGERIFEKLFRSDNVRKTDTDGTGIGLYIVKHTVEAWGGSLWFESEEGKGTTFHFTAPRKMEPKTGEGKLTR